MSDNDDTERAGTSARVDRGLRPAVPPDAPASDSDADADPHTGFDGVPRDWASAADRRANAGGGRFGGTPANEGPPTAPTPASLRRAAAGGTPVELPAEYGGPARTDEPAAPAPADADSGSAAGTASAANHGSAVDLPAEYGGPEREGAVRPARPVPRDADWAAAATDRPMPAADHWGVEDPSAPVERPGMAAETAVGHVRHGAGPTTVDLPDGDITDADHPDAESIDSAHPDVAATGHEHRDGADSLTHHAAASRARTATGEGLAGADAGGAGRGVVTGAEGAGAGVGAATRDAGGAGRGVVTGAEGAGAGVGAATRDAGGAGRGVVTGAEGAGVRTATRDAGDAGAGVVTGAGTAVAGMAGAGAGAGAGGGSVGGAESAGVGAAARDAGGAGRGAVAGAGAAAAGMAGAGSRVGIGPAAGGSGGRDTGETADGGADAHGEAGGTRERVGAAAAGTGTAAAAGFAARRDDTAGDVREGAAGHDVEESADPTFGTGHRRAPEDEPAWNRPSGVSPVTRSERRAAEAAAAAKATGTTGMAGGFGHVVWALTRVLLGFVFLWAFLDRLFGLGLPTPRESAWREGGSPTTGYLDAVEGPLRTWADTLAGRSWVDWVFMIALAAIAVALILGIGVTLAAIGGAILLLMIYAASLPLGDNPFVNQHLIYALVLIGIAFTGAGLRYSLAPWWRRTALVRKLPFLR